MHASLEVLIAGVFLASAVEMVEALTIVVATGTTRGWRSTLEGAGTAVIVLAVLAAALGPALVHFVPLRALRLVVGGILLVFGQQWWRKAILRSSGHLAKHDEDAIYSREVAALSKIPLREQGRDTIAFAVAFKGVFLEGLEVIVVVITLGSASHEIGVACAAAGAAVVLVTVVGLIVAKQLSRVPENTMKMAVALMLVSFGSFWSGEGIGVRWPGSDLAIPVLVAIYGATTFLALVILRSGSTTSQITPEMTEVSATAGTAGTAGTASGAGAAGAADSPSANFALRTSAKRALVAFGAFWWDFLVGDTPELFVGSCIIMGITAAIVHGISRNAAAFTALPVMVFALVGTAVARARSLSLL